MTSDDGFCSVHAGAKRAAHVLVGMKCGACRRVIRAGDWITRDSTMTSMSHAVCPTPRQKPAPDDVDDRGLIQIARADIGETEL